MAADGPRKSSSNARKGFQKRESPAHPLRKILVGNLVEDLRVGLKILDSAPAFDDVEFERVIGHLFTGHVVLDGQSLALVISSHSVRINRGVSY